MNKLVPQNLTGNLSNICKQ